MLSRDPVEAKEISPNISEKELEEIGGPATSITLSGPELITLNDCQWDQLCKYDEIVFARTTPEQKLRIVKGRCPKP
jgi:sodium/potassium-transporting ATPase subunit alpha